MAYAVLADIHGNLTALAAVIADLGRRGISEVLQGGDVALVGPRPVEVVDRVRELGWPGVVGNTDELLWRPEEHERLRRATPQLAPLFELLFEHYAPATREALGPERMQWLRELPAEHRRGEALILHASRGNLWRAPMPEDEDDVLEDAYGALEARLVIYGHIHRPFVRRVGEALTVANTGSVGMPWDGDPRASYLVVDGDEVEIVRVGYDIEREAESLLASGDPDAPRVATMLREARFVLPGE